MQRTFNVLVKASNVYDNCDINKTYMTDDRSILMLPVNM